MKKILKKVIKEFVSDQQVNLQSETAQNVLVESIVKEFEKDPENWIHGMSMELKEKKLYKDAGDGHLLEETIQEYKDKLSESIVDNKEKKYIFESPDGGKTVFKREFDSTEREEIKSLDDNE